MASYSVFGAPDFSLKDRQLAAVKQMLNLNQPTEDATGSELTWKVLVFDTHCSDILAPLIKVGGLRQLGVTLHLLLHSDRQAVPDAPAVYFVSPTKDNIVRIVRDCAGKLYDPLYINFSSHVGAGLMEELARSLVEHEALDGVASVHDQYCDFVCLERDLFTLEIADAYRDLHGHDERRAEACVAAIVDSLFSVVVTLGVLPIIRCPRATAAEVIATALDARLREHLVNHPSTFAGTGDAAGGGGGGSAAATAQQRPLLVLLDRDVDVPIMVGHSWTYQPMVHDLLAMRNNRVRVSVEEKSMIDSAATTTVIKTYDIDSQHDAFWASNATSTLQSVAADVQKQLEEITAASRQVERLRVSEDPSSSSSSAHDDSGGDILTKTRNLNEFAKTVPELTEKKKLLDMHTNVATALFRHIKERSLDRFFALEESLLSSAASASGRISSQDKEKVREFLTNPTSGEPRDKLRLLLIYFLLNDHLARDELDDLEKLLVDAKPDEVAAFNFVRKNRSLFSRDSAAQSIAAAASSAAAASAALGRGGAFMQKGFSSLSSLMSAVQSSISNLMPSTRTLAVTRIVDSLMELRSGGGGGGSGGGSSGGADRSPHDSYLYLDARLPKSAATAPPPRRAAPFRDAIVFLVGGGNYAEYQNLLDYAKTGATSGRTSAAALPGVPAKRIIYGVTELLSPQQFLSQMADLGGRGTAAASNGAAPPAAGKS